MSTGFHSIFQSASNTACSAALFGILFHQAARNVEFELYMYHVMALSTVAYFGLIYALAQVEPQTLSGAIWTSTLFATCFNTTVLSSIAVYRLFFHRCRNFPGPLPAKITRFYAAYLSAKDVQYYKELAKVHEKYGDFVRTGLLHHFRSNSRC
jgi:hypothetical protein